VPINDRSVRDSILPAYQKLLGMVKAAYDKDAEARATPGPRTLADVAGGKEEDRLELRQSIGGYQAYRLAACRFSPCLGLGFRHGAQSWRGIELKRDSRGMPADFPCVYLSSVVEIRVCDSREEHGIPLASKAHLPVSARQGLYAPEHHQGVNNE